MALTILSEQDIVLIHEATLDVLENTGVTFLNVPEAVKILKSNGCKVDGSRVFIPRQLVETSV
jgi:trimethylamine--corrinoid protein Co-methyltransferase